MKRLRWLWVFGCCVGCNAIVGNDGQFAPTSQGGSEAVPGHSTSALVSAGEVSKSSHYKMVFSVGQTSPVQEKTRGTQSSMDNGLICKDGR